MEVRREQRTANSTYPKVAVRWLNQALYFNQSLCLTDSESLRNRHLRVAATRWHQYKDETRISMEYKINSRRQIKLLKSDLTGYLIGVIVLGIFVWIKNEGNLIETIVVTLIALTPILLPLIILHVNYYLVNRNLIVTIDRKNNLISINKLESKKTFAFEDIEDVLITKGICYKNEKSNRNAPNIFSDPVRVPWSDYGYIKIYFKSKKVVALTALMIDLKEIPFDNYKTEYKLIPLITD